MTYYRRKHYYDDREPLFLLLGDDLEWNEQNFGNYSEDIIIMPAGDPMEDLCLLVSCDALILSASSFSWWAGYLNGGPVVVSALVARNGSPLANELTLDYYMPGWTIL